MSERIHSKIIQADETDVSTYWLLIDASTGDPKTDITVTDLDFYYVKKKAAISSKVDATALVAATSDHTDNGAYNVGQGVYRIDWPDACFAGDPDDEVFLLVVCTGVETAMMRVVLSPSVNPWDSLRADHTVAGSFGEGIANILGLNHQDVFIDQITYDDDGNRSGGRIRIYSDTASVGTDENVLATFTVTAIYRNSRLYTYKVVQA